MTPPTYVPKYAAERYTAIIEWAKRDVRPLVRSEHGCQCPHCGRFIAEDLAEVGE